MTTGIEYHGLVVRAQAGDTEAFCKLIDPVKS